MVGFGGKWRKIENILEKVSKKRIISYFQPNARLLQTKAHTELYLRVYEDTKKYSSLSIFICKYHTQILKLLYFYKTE
jgi:hypothetical protein